MQRSQNLLVRRPAPRLTESLLGYLLRLSEANGFATPWTLLVRAEMEQYELRTTGIKTQKIAAITGRHPAYLEAIAYADVNSGRFCRLLNHPLSIMDLELRCPVICPECIRDRGFIEAHWDLRLMIAWPRSTSMLWLG
jgi:hypothetical protein